MRITKEEMINGKSIYEVFQQKVNSISEYTIIKQRFINMTEFRNGTIFFNLDDMFLHLVYEKESIVSHHLKTVLKTLEETQIRQIYLVYPKHDKFKKHIQIKLAEETKLAEDEYQVKIIPYSFSFS